MVTYSKTYDEKMRSALFNREINFTIEQVKGRYTMPVGSVMADFYCWLNGQNSSVYGPETLVIWRVKRFK